MTEFDFKVGTVKELKAQLNILIEKSTNMLKGLENKGIDSNFSIKYIYILTL